MSRFEYENKHVIEADEFNQSAWADVRRESQSVANLVAKGEPVVGKTFDSLVDDTFQSLYQYTPEPRENVGPELTFNKTLVEQLQSSHEYDNLRVESFLDADMSALGALMLSDKIIEQVGKDKKLQDMIKEMNRPQEKKPGGKEKGEGAGAGDQPSEEESDEEGEQEDQQAKTPTPEQTKAIRRMVEKAAKAAGEKLAEASSVMSGYGIGKGELKSMPLDERMKFIEQMLKNDRLKDIAERVGRIDRIINTTKLTRVKHGAEEIVDITLGNDLSRLTPREIVMMDEAEDDFLRRYANRELIQYELEGQEPTGKGPMVILIDKSGSMGGENDNWATAITFSLMMQASKEKRDVFYAAFDDGILFSKRMVGGQYGYKDLLELAAIAVSGGTNFEKPIQFGLEACQSDPKLREADIVFVTDGSAPLSDETIKRINDQKKIQDVNIFTVLVCEYGNVEDHVLAKISTEMHGISKLIGITGENVGGVMASMVNGTNL